MGLIEALNKFQTIETKRLVLRRVAEEDLKDIFEISSNPEVTQHISWETHQSLEQTRELLNKYLDSYNQNTIRDWGVELKESKKIIGLAGFLPEPKDINEPDIGYIFNKDYWHKHFATEAVQEILKFGFEKANLKKITAYCVEHHQPSQKVLTNCGFSFEKHDTIQTQKGSTEKVKRFTILIDNFKDGRVKQNI